MTTLSKIAGHDAASQLFKDREGAWTATTNIDLGDGKRRLDISTTKGSRGEIATMVWAVEPTEYGFTHVMFQDFEMTIRGEKVRATEKSVKTAHDKVMESAEALISAAKAHYAKA